MVSYDESHSNIDKIQLRRQVMLTIILLYVFLEAIGTLVFIAFRIGSLKENAIAFDIDMFLYMIGKLAGMSFYVNSSSKYECLLKFAIDILFLIIYIVVSMRLFPKKKQLEIVENNIEE